MRWALLSLVLTVGAAVACGARTGLEAPTHAGGGGPGAQTGAGAGGGGGRALPDDCADAGTAPIYVITDHRDLYAFAPTDNVFTSLGKATCVPSGAFSMAVDRAGRAYVESQSHSRIFRLSLADPSACEETPFSPGEAFDFGTAFSANTSGGGETLFLSGPAVGEKGDFLFSLNVDTFEVHKIGPFSKFIGAWAELTGTADGRLYAFGVNINTTDHTHLATIDKNTAEVLDQVDLSFDNSGGWAFAWWGGVFYLFTSNFGPSVVRRYDPSTQELKTVAHAPGQVVGAGVSTCAPVD